MSQTAGTIPPDVVLDILRRPARERFGLILTELGIGLTGRGEDLNTTLRRAVPALRETDKVLNILADNRRTINALTRDADRTLIGIARNRRDVGRFVREAGDTTQASASRASALRSTVNKLPGFLRELRPTLAELGTTARLQTPALRDLRRAAPDLTEFLHAPRPVRRVRAARRARPRARVGHRHRRGHGGALHRQAAARARHGEHRADAQPALRARGPQRPRPRRRAQPAEPGTGAGFTGLEAFLQFFFVQSQAINIYDSKGYLLKLNVLLNECSQYTNAQTAIEHADRTARCRQWLGPNQPGVTSDAVARTTPNKPRRAPRRRARRPPSRRRPPRPSRARRRARRHRRPPPPSNKLDPRDLLDKLLPPGIGDNLPPALRPKGGSSSSSSNADSERNLLDYLLGP